MIQTIKNIQQQLQDGGFYSKGICEPIPKNYVDGSWGPGSQEALQAAIETGEYKMDFDFAKFKTVFKRSSLKQPLVDSINYLFNAFNEYNKDGGSNPLNVAYMLGTAWHETAYTLLPIKEYGSNAYLSKYDTGRLARILGNTPQADGDGQLYAGRGYVMITGKSNYEKFSKILGIDLLKNPTLALQPEYSAKILVHGCLFGTFTGVKLSDSIKYGKYREFVAARKVVNGTDKDRAIADHTEKFLKCLKLVKIQTQDLDLSQNL